MIYALACLLAVAACGSSTPPPAVDAPATPVADAPPDAFVLPDTCDVVDQDCPASYKCTLVAMPLLERGCRPVTGAVQEGQTCTGVDGADDCAGGLLCVDNVCRRFCDHNAECGSGAGCVTYRTLDSLCMPSCTPFDATSCPVGQTCELAPGADAIAGAFCRPIGTLALGAPCQNGPLDSVFQRCGVDDSCLGGSCRPLCDDTHACPAAGACTRPTGVSFADPGHAGVCLE